MNRAVRVVGVLMLAGLLAACAGSETKEGGEAPEVIRGGEGAEGAAAGREGTEGAATSALPDGGGVRLDPLDDPESPLANRIVYFAFDSSEITPEAQALIVEHARYLALNPGLRVVLEGHADERGSREYNIGLGERRAQAVRRLMLFQGVSDPQIEVVSYGEERPADPGHDEPAWARNRRVEIVYQR